MTDFLNLPLSVRTKEAKRLFLKYPDRIPTIVFPIDSLTPKIEKQKFLIKRESALHELNNIIRSKINVKSNEALFLFVGDDKLCNVSLTFNEIHSRFQNKDGFLYIKYSLENCFG